MEQDDTRRLLVLYNCLYKETDEVYRDLARHFGLPDCAFWILYLLRETSRVYTQSALSDTLSLSKQTVNSALKNLEAEGYLCLETPAENRRNKCVRLTPAGEGLAAKTVDRVLAMEQKAFAHFSAQEQADFVRLNQKHVRQLRAQADQILAQPRP